MEATKLLFFVNERVRILRIITITSEEHVFFPLLCKVVQIHQSIASGIINQLLNVDVNHQIEGLIKTNRTFVINHRLKS